MDAACLVGGPAGAPLIVVATESGRTALALSNRRPTATILAVDPDGAAGPDAGRVLGGDAGGPAGAGYRRARAGPGGREGRRSGES